MRRIINQNTYLYNSENNNNNIRPSFVVFRLLFTPFVRILGLPSTLQPFFTAIWSVTSTLVSIYGRLPTLRALWALRLAIRHEQPVEQILAYVPVVTRILIREMTPFWTTLLGSSRGIITYLTMVVSTTVFYALRPLVGIIISWSFSLICSALGIFWSETLRSFEFLLSYARAVKNFFKATIGFELPIPRELRDSNLKKFTLLFVGAVTFGFSLLGLDYFNHDFINSIPCMQTIIRWYYNFFLPITASFRFFLSIINFFRSLNTPNVAPTGGLPSNPLNPGSNSNPNPGPVPNPAPSLDNPWNLGG